MFVEIACNFEVLLGSQTCCQKLLRIWEGEIYDLSKCKEFKYENTASMLRQNWRKYSKFSANWLVSKKSRCALKTTSYRSNAGKIVIWKRQSSQIFMDNPVFLIHNYCQTTLGNSHKLPVRPACIFILHILSPKLSEHQGATKLNMNSIIHNLRINFQQDDQHKITSKQNVA